MKYMHRVLLCSCALGFFLLHGFFASEGAGPTGAEPATKGVKGAKPFGLDRRKPWTVSAITGSPEPPLPYTTERVFPKLTFKNPLLLTTAPGMNRFFVCEQAGRILSFPIDPKCAHADLAIDLREELSSWDKSKVRGVNELYGLAFHPQFVRNRFCYVCYILNGTGREPLADGSRISRFRVTETDPPRIDPGSEKVILTWLAGGHNGCDIHFGPDGFLYISTGDGANPNPPDALNTGQDISDLLSSILRIDVDHESAGKPYTIPPDNPFVTTPKARPEVWAYGFRNPWRMSFDRQTGDLWVGDVGWEQWEMIYRVQKGGNYGWSVMEGPQPVRPESKRGPTPILPPAFSFPHTEAASITGGFVYRGTRLKELAGVYICGDWVTRKIWGTRFEGDKVVWHKELAQGKERIVAFGEDHDKDLYFVNHDEKGSLHRLVPNALAASKSGGRSVKDFPRKLSETGLFASVVDHTLSPGVVPFSVNSKLWSDHAGAERMVALPGTSTVKMYDTRPPWPDYSGDVFFPKDGVLAKTFSIELESGNPKSRRRLETQILHYDGSAWKGYTYAWNDEQTDAALVPAAGLDRKISVVDETAPGKRREQKWHYPSRAECLTCHNPWAGYTLAFNVHQLNKEHNYGGVMDNQLRTLQHIDVVSFRKRDWDTGEEDPQPQVPPQRLANPADATINLDDRARSYLHVNCSHCHQFGAGGTADLDLRFNTPLEKTKTLDVRPVQGAFEILGGQIVAPADPYRSVLYYRMAKLGPGRMPHLGSEIVDERGLKLIHDWISQLPVRKDERILIEKLSSLDELAHVTRERSEWLPQLRRVASSIARSHKREEPTDADRAEAEARLKKQVASQAKTRAAERGAAIQELLASTRGALLLSSAVAEQKIPDLTRQEVLTAAMALSNSLTRDLFERFVSDDARPKRLGSIIRPQEILQRKGNREQGRELFFKGAGLQCATCHRIGATGSTLGPDLTEIGKKYSRAQILESILEPSKFIDQKYVAYLVETTDGKLLTGIVASKTEKELVLRMAGDKEVRLASDQIASLLPQQKSLMPELLLRDVTLEQATDLLEFLAHQK